ncbi:hypothetical protein [Micromonospora sp. ATCC 39149]|uniref:hypothetical protein n=1 Tax=Micromonospora sp. (strain ATCC 39149 / NRRL 15099 / SCC 1413) TaxID=219305 RepID=UPI0002EEC78D|nr:hypothetical protein [Micromonospora sp. ATCC 39149]
MITLIVELSCDATDCDIAYAPAVDELTDVQATRKGAMAEGWARRDGKDYCPGHHPEAALITVITGLAAKGHTDSEIADGLDWSRWKVQQFRARHGIQPGVSPGRPAQGRERGSA